MPSERASMPRTVTIATPQVIRCLRCRFHLTTSGPALRSPWRRRAAAVGTDAERRWMAAGDVDDWCCWIPASPLPSLA